MSYFQFHDDYFDTLSTRIGRECTFYVFIKSKKNTLPFAGEYFLYLTIYRRRSFHDLLFQYISKIDYIGFGNVF